MRNLFTVPLSFRGWPLLLLCHCSAGMPASGESGEDDAAVVNDEAGGDAMPGLDRKAAVDTRSDSRGPADAARKDVGVADAKLSPDVYFPPVTCADNLLFCEDFESGGVDPSRWSPANWVYYHKSPSNVSVAIDEAEARGSHAVRFRQTSQGPDKDGWLRPNMQFPLGNGRLFIRFFIFIEKPTPNRWFPVFFTNDPTKVATDKDSTQQWALGLLPQSEKVVATSRFWLLTGSGGFESSGPYVPEDKWACWEIELRGDEKRMVVSLDDTQINSMGIVNATASPANIALNFGYKNGHEDIITHPGDGFFDIWFDDIAVSKERIGCGSAVVK